METDENGGSPSGELDTNEANGEIASPDARDAMATGSDGELSGSASPACSLDLNDPASPTSIQSPDGQTTDAPQKVGGDSSPQDNAVVPRDLPSDDEDDSVSDGSRGEVKVASPAKDSAETVSSQESDLDLRGAHDDHGELDYEEDVVEETAEKMESSLGKTDAREEGEEEEEEEEGEHISDDDDTDGELDDDDDCEEGEIKDSADVADEGSLDCPMDEEDPTIHERDIGYANNQPVCRFFMHGTCHWGANCRFIHPGIRTAGTYMKETVIPKKVWIPEEKEAPPPPPRSTSPVTETAWERGLRQAKELRKKSQKRKEAEPDFEEKRKNLSINTSAENLEEEEAGDKEPVVKDDNKENEREKFQRDPYYDGVFEDVGSPYGAKHGWHGSGQYDNFEVSWGSREPYHHQHHPSHQEQNYPDFRIPERDRHMYKDDSHHPYNRHDKRKEQKYRKRDGFDLNQQLKSRGGPPKDRPLPYTRPENRGDQWADPWQRAKSPVRRKNSSSRSRSRSRRRSGSFSSSFSSGSFSSRSRSSSYSSYSRSSSSSSRSSMSRSRSPPVVRKHPPAGPPTAPPAKKPVPAKPSEVPRSFITKAGPVVGSRALNKNDRPQEKPRHPVDNRIPEGPAMPPKLRQPDPQRPSGNVDKTKPPAKPAAGPTSIRKPFHSDTRPGRSLRRRTSHSSGSSSRSSSSSRSRSSSSSSSGSSGADSDNLYGNMASPSKFGKSKSPSPHKRRDRNSTKDGGRPPHHKRDASYKSSAPPPRDGDRRRSPNPRDARSWKSDDRPRTSSQHDKDKTRSQGDKRQLSTSQPATKPSVHTTAKDPLKLQGQKSNIKLTLKSNKPDAVISAAKKRPAVEESSGPPAKKIGKSPIKEPKEPLRITLPKTDKLIKPPVKELGSKTTSSSAPSQPSKAQNSHKSSTSSSTPKSAAESKKPAPAPAPTAAPTAAPAPAKKKSTSSRREELLKQLKAVEDAIARKRTK